MVPLPEIDEIELRHCPRCEQDLPLYEFGVCRSRKDGLNLYDRRCINQKISKSRERLREYKQTRAKNGLDPTEDKKQTQSPSARRIARMLRKLPPVDRVHEVICMGSHSQDEITRLTKLAKDEVTDCLAELLLDRGAISTKVIKGKRMYFDNVSPNFPTRKPMSLSSPSFSSVKAIMPGKVRSAA